MKNIESQLMGILAVGQSYVEKSMKSLRTESFDKDAARRLLVNVDNAREILGIALDKLEGEVLKDKGETEGEARERLGEEKGGVEVKMGKMV